MRPALLRNATLVRALGSFGLAFTAEWSFTVAIGLVAWADGGALAVGLVGTLRLLPAAVLAPVVAAWADRVPRERVLGASSLVRGTSTLAAGVLLATGGPAWAVYALAVVATVAFIPFRAAHSALVPSLCRTPDDLTAVNVARSGLDSLSVVVGPLAAAFLVAVGDVAAVLLFAGACALAAALLLLRLDYEHPPLVARPRRLLTEVREGVAAVAADRGVAVVVALVVLQTVVRGAFTVLVVVVTLDLLDRPEADAGVVQGLVGVGALLGSAACVLLVGSRAMTRWLGVAVALWGAPLALVGLLPSWPTALVAAAVIGVGNALVDVTAFTLLARMTPDDVMARVFGVLESAGALGVAAGALVAPLAVALLGTRGALVTIGAVAPAVCVLGWRGLRAVDRTVTTRTDELAVLREVPMLRPLPVPALEQLGRGLTVVDLAADQVLFRAGDPGEQFFVVADGTLEVLDGPRLVRTLGRGDGLGEIALLGRRPRTMTVRAATPARLYAVGAEQFLVAMAGFGAARAVAERTRAEHLRNAPGEAAS